MTRLTSTKLIAAKTVLAATAVAGLLLTGCSKPGGKSAVDKSMAQSGVYGGRNSGPNASNMGGADGAGGSPVGTSVPHSAGGGNTVDGNHTGPE